MGNGVTEWKPLLMLLALGGLFSFCFALGLGLFGFLARRWNMAICLGWEYGHWDLGWVGVLGIGKGED